MTTRLPILLGALAVFGGTALAQTGTYTTSGEGRIAVGPSQDRFSRVVLTLERNQNFTLRTESGRSETLRGRWVYRGGRAIELRVESGFGRSSTTGTGSVEVDTSEVRRLDLSGRTGNTDYRIRFADDEDQGLGRGNGRWNMPGNRDDDVRDWRSRVGSLNAVERGSGHLRIDGRTVDRVEQARVVLERDGDARITLIGDRTTVLTGKWTGGRSNVIDLDIREGLGSSNARGTGKLTLDRDNGFRQLNLQGRTQRGNDRFEVAFNARDRGGNDQNDSDRLRRYAGNYSYDKSWRDRGERYIIRYRLDLRSDGRADMDIDADNDLVRSDQLIRDNGEILRYLDREGKATQTGRWYVDGDRITVKFDRLAAGFVTPRLETTLEGRYRDGRIEFTEFNRGLYGRTTDFEFRR